MDIDIQCPYCETRTKTEYGPGFNNPSIVECGICKSLFAAHTQATYTTTVYKLTPHYTKATTP